MMFSVGDRVVINDYGHEEYGTGETNPLWVAGTVFEVNPDEENGFYYKVKWDNGLTNDYEHGTLDLISVELENK